MLEILRKFFHFCDERERREFYRSIALGVAAALFSALKIPAIGILLGAMLTDGVRTLTANIVLEMAYADFGLHRGALIASAVVLFVFILLINLSFSLIRKKS